MPCITIHCSLYNKHSSQMTVMIEGIKCSKNMYPSVSSKPALGCSGTWFHTVSVSAEVAKWQTNDSQKVLFIKWGQTVSCCSLPVSCNARRCAAEWDRCGAALGFHRSCCWNTETSHSRHPLNSPGNSESQLRGRKFTINFHAHTDTTEVCLCYFAVLCCTLKRKI